MQDQPSIEYQLAKAIIETSNALIIVMDTEGRIQRFNQGCEKITGYAEDEVKGRIFWDFLIPEEQAPGVRAVFNSLKARDFPNEYENDWLTKEGEQRRIAWSNTAIVDEAGKVTHVIGTGLDITQRIAAEAALKRREELYALAQRAAHIGSWDWIVDTGELIWSETVEDIFGYERGAFPGAFEAFLSRVHPQDRERVLAAIAASVDENAEYEVEHRIVLPDGTTRWVVEIGDVLRDATGAPERMIGVVQEITERKKAEEALRQERDLLENTIESLPHPFYVINVEDYTIEIANSASGYRDGEQAADHITCYELTHKSAEPCNTSQHPCPLREVQRTHQPATAEHIHYNHERQPRYIEVHSYPIFDEAGEVRQVIEYTLDITERKEAEEALRHKRDILDKMMETSPSAITLVNLQGEIVFANSQAEELFQLTKEDITSRTYNAPTWRGTDLEGNPLRDDEYPFQRILQEQRPLYDMRHAIELPGGKRIILTINGAPLVDQAGGLSGIVFTINDITERVQETQQRIEQLKQEVQILNTSMGSPSNVTAQMFGVKSLRKNYPDIFSQLIARYIHALELAIEQRIYKVEHAVSEELRALAERLGSLNAGPRDIVELHTQSLVRVTEEKNGKHTTARDWKAKAYTEEGRLIALELMGYLAGYYQIRCAGDHITAQTGGDYVASS